MHQPTVMGIIYGKQATNESVTITSYSPQPFNKHRNLMTLEAAQNTAS